MNKKQIVSLMILVALCGGAVYALRFAGPPKTPEEEAEQERMTQEWLGKIEASPIKVTSKSPYRVSYTNTKGLTRYPDAKTATKGVEITTLGASYNPNKESIDVFFRVKSVSGPDKSGALGSAGVYHLKLKNSVEQNSNAVMGIAENIFPPAYGFSGRSRGARRLHMAIMQMFNHIATNLDYIKKNYVE